MILLESTRTGEFSSLPGDTWEKMITSQMGTVLYPAANRTPGMDWGVEEGKGLNLL